MSLTADAIAWQFSGEGGPSVVVVRDYLSTKLR